MGANPASEDGVKGVAPDVTFGSYRVFGCEGSTSTDIMIAAMERAQADGMDILNMSIGSAFMTWPQYPTAAAADALVDEGMVVVTSIGNSGASGVYSASAPGVGRNVIGVASYDNSHVELPTFTITPDGQQIGYGNATGAPAAPTSGTLPMARTGTQTSTADGCAALPAGSMSGKAVLIRRGTCGFHAKALNAQNAGAAAVVLYNNVSGRINPTVVGMPEITIPVVAISDQEGVLIDNRLATGPVDMTWTDETGSFVNPTGGLISSTSSFGLTAELDVKPDLGAPGGLIRSTWPLEGGAYATISGTSMASPHVAGAAALLMEARPSCRPPTSGRCCRTAPTRSRGRAIRARVPRQRAPAGRRHARYRRLDPVDDDGDARQARARRERGRPGGQDADDQQRSGVGGHVRRVARCRAGKRRPDELAWLLRELRDGGVRRTERHRARGWLRDARRNDHGAGDGALGSTAATSS